MFHSTSCGLHSVAKMNDVLTHKIICLLLKAVDWFFQKKKKKKLHSVAQTWNGQGFTGILIATMLRAQCIAEGWLYLVNLQNRTEVLFHRSVLMVIACLEH